MHNSILFAHLKYKPMAPIHAKKFAGEARSSLSKKDFEKLQDFFKINYLTETLKHADHFLIDKERKIQEIPGAVLSVRIMPPHQRDELQFRLQESGKQLFFKDLLLDQDWDRVLNGSVAKIGPGNVRSELMKRNIVSDLGRVGTAEVFRVNRVDPRWSECLIMLDKISFSKESLWRKDYEIKVVTFKGSTVNPTQALEEILSQNSITPVSTLPKFQRFCAAYNIK